MRDGLCTSECLVKVLELHLARIEKSGVRRGSGLREWRIDEGAQTAMGFQVAQARIREDSHCGFPSIHRALSGGLVRRSPWYPKVEVVPVQS